MDGQESMATARPAKQSSQWPAQSSAVHDALAAIDWSHTLLGPLAKWPWHWRAAVTATFDPGPGRRSGEGTATIVPFLVKSLAAKVAPERGEG
jgi:hypothetical protein